MTNNTYDENKVATVSDRLKLILDLKNMKQADLAHKTGINTPSISSYVTGKYEPRFSVLDKMAAALNVSTKWLAGYDVPMEQQEPVSDKKNNDAMADIIVKMRHSDDFFLVINKLSQLKSDDLKFVNMFLSDNEFFDFCRQMSVISKDKRQLLIALMK